jgi:hypothetical protein
MPDDNKQEPVNTWSPEKADLEPISEAHIELLEARWRAVQSGEDKLLDWDEVKHTIGRH